MLSQIAAAADAKAQKQKTAINLQFPPKDYQKDGPFIILNN